MLGGFAALAKLTGATVRDCVERQNQVASQTNSIRETEGATTAKFKASGYFSRRLIQKCWQLEGSVKENDSHCLAKNVIFQKNEYGM